MVAKFSPGESIPGELVPRRKLPPPFCRVSVHVSLSAFAFGGLALCWVEVRSLFKAEALAHLGLGRWAPKLLLVVDLRKQWAFGIGSATEITNLRNRQWVPPIGTEKDRPPHKSQATKPF